MDFQKGSLQIDGETVNDDFKEVVLTHPSILQAEKRINDLEAQLSRVLKYLEEVDKGLIVKKINDLGEIEYVRF